MISKHKYSETIVISENVRNAIDQAQYLIK